MTGAAIANKIPHEYRQKILLDWLPTVAVSWNNKSFKLLWEAYFIYVEPDGVKQDSCAICMNNVIKNWRNISPFLAAAEREYNELEAL